jgi:copper homeostasis protein
MSGVDVCRDLPGLGVREQGGRLSFACPAAVLDARTGGCPLCVVTPDPFETLEQLIGLGFRRVMTSGQEETASNGAGLIAGLIGRAAGRIEVLPAAGINRFTAADVVARTGCGQVHASLRNRREDRSVWARPQVSFGGPVKVPEDGYDATSEGAVTELRGLLGQPA